MKTKKRCSLIIGSVAIILATGVLMLKADCPGKAVPGGKCTTSSPAASNNSCVTTACNQDNTITGSCAEATDGNCSTYTVQWSCNMTEYTKDSGGNCLTSGVGHPANPPSSSGVCTLTSGSCN